MEGGKKDIVQIMRDAQNEESMESKFVAFKHFFDDNESILNMLSFFYLSSKIYLGFDTP